MKLTLGGPPPSSWFLIELCLEQQNCFSGQKIAFDIPIHHDFNFNYYHQINTEHDFNYFYNVKYLHKNYFKWLVAQILWMRKGKEN